MKKDREDVMRVASDILQAHGIELDQTELRQLLGVPPTVEAQPPEKWPPLDNGTLVRTKLDPATTNWAEEARRSRRDNTVGVIVGYHDSHGLTYEVRHHVTPGKSGWLRRMVSSPFRLMMLRREWTIGHYEPQELILVQQEARLV